jgi:hypothetical protein
LIGYATKFGGKGIVPAADANYDGYKTLGVGDLAYKDLNGDGKISQYGDNSSEGDMVFLGSEHPKLTYGFTGNASYKGFDMGVIIQGTGDKYTYRSGIHGYPYYAPWWCPISYFYGKTFSQGSTPYYAKNLDAQYPRVSHDGNVKSNNQRASDVFIDNTKYVRLKNITLGYTLPKSMLKKVNIENVRVYFSGQDIFTIAKGTREGQYDPEMSGQNNNSSEAVYPFYATYSFGIDITF